MSGGAYTPWGDLPLSASGGGTSSDPAAGAASVPEVPGTAAHGRDAGTASATGAKPARDGGLSVAGAVFPPAPEPDPCAIMLDDFVAGVLAIVAAHDQLDPRAWVTRAICAAADDIGLGVILDELKVKVAEADGDLRQLPDFERAAVKRPAKSESSDGGE